MTICPKCEDCTSEVRDSRLNSDGYTRRRRWCLNPGCGHGFTTYEVSKDTIRSQDKLNEIKRALKDFIKIL